MRIFIYICALIISFPSLAQQSTPQDSTEIVHVVEEFYDWYITAIHDKTDRDFQPYFKEDSAGNTTLHLETYLSNLRAHGFSDSLLTAEKESYNYCLTHLSNIPYNQRDSLLIDLDQYEEIQCDFSNYYRWSGEQEPMDGFRINSYKAQGKTAIVNITFSNLQNRGSVYWYPQESSIKLSFIQNEWKINGI